MSLPRRSFLRLAGLVAAGATLSACAPVYARLAGDPQPFAGWPPVGADHFPALSRMTFGPRAEERLRAAEVGLNEWIEEQLAHESLDDQSLHWRLQNFETLTMSATELADWSAGLFDDVDKQSVPRELAQATLIRQVHSRRQLYEVMVEFWSDHFNISVEKGDGWFLKTVDDREVIRPHALGKFRDLLWASAHSPAMLVYLDNQVNRKGAPNENYARELMELHSLGVDGGYTQKDVQELARCLTGWSVKETFWRGDFKFDADQHDTGIKTVLGVTIAPDGQGEAERVVERLAAHPSTARFIAAKLARRFLSDDPPPQIVEKAAAAFTENDGDIRAVLRVILFDGLALAQPKFKRPVNFVASSLRMLNATTDGGAALFEHLARMGQVHFHWPTPDGYPDRSGAWGGNLMPRWQFALALARNEIKGARIDLPEIVQASGAASLDEVVDRVSALLLGAPLASSVRDDLVSSLRAGEADEEALPQIITAGLLASPAFQWR
jgi:uncharacterized protein (DUF1800 family)